ncbi:MAG: hypothetical protein NC400_08415 [Clostridium sp.]|nr:hypothetical protein [Clostridium sp.]
MSILGIMNISRILNIADSGKCLRRRRGKSERIRVDMRKICEAVLIFLGTVGWWGFVYPELCLTGEAYEEQEQPQEEPEADEACEGQTQEELQKQQASGETCEGQKQTQTQREADAACKDQKQTQMQARGEPSEVSGNQTQPQKQPEASETCKDQKQPQPQAQWEPGGIRIKSRIAEYVYQVKENVITEKRLKDDK